MAVGMWLQRVARGICSSALCDRVLEPAIADLQHEYAQPGPAWRRRLLGGYAAFWWSFAWCVARDAVASESRRDLGAAAVTFAIAVFTMATAELLSLHTLPALRAATLRLLYWGPYLPYVGWSAWINVATLTFGVPLAMFPVLLVAARGRSNGPHGSALLTIAAGMLVTVVSSGWLAPAVVRWGEIRQRNQVFATGGRLVLPGDYFDACPDCQAWPGLIRGAFAPLKHRYAGYPNYVAPEDRGLPAWYRAVLRERLLLAIFAMLAGLAGWALGLRASTAGTARGAR
jgi:hypothetical protein